MLENNMKRFSNVFVVLFLVIGFLSSPARAVDAEDLSERLTETMREIQARYNYFNINYTRAEYLCWDDDLDEN